ncbi:type II CRISPR RNA-guided endonuclease Cas9 [Saccharicrinis sp. FJH62]|uniref:type II CRISPR RNA-guided endonuclease Cas9 n=1 Tax=Saccharicrinis sp. FJH62 TaxID=3344657 RepID=UPI0035D476D7
MKILGLDLGTNSIGWAVVENEDEKFTLLNKGVRIFQEGVKIEKGIEGSKAAERTGFRSARRLKYRRKIRKINTLRVLSLYGFCPELTGKELSEWKNKKIYPTNQKFLEWQRTDEVTKKNPYHFRALAVEQKLNLNREEDRYKIGRAFYHIAQRRGFLSNRLEGTKESDGAVKKTITEISESKGNKTLGQYFFEKYKRNEKIRNTYTHREDHYLEEFNKICEFQNLDREFTEQIKKAIFYQRLLKSQKGTIGKCVFELNKHRCAVSRPEFEEYRMLCFVNNIKIKTPEDEQLRFLTDVEKDKIALQFYRKSKDHFDFEDLAKQLSPKKQYKYFKERDINPEDWLFNYSMKTTVSGCPVSSRFKDLFGDDFMNIQIEYNRESDGRKSVIDINDIWHVLYSYDSDEKLAEFARNRLIFNDYQIKEFLKIRLKQDYASLSLKAIRKILPYLRKGLIYSHAIFLANMEEVIPNGIWRDEKNQDYIRDEIKLIIDTQNEEKDIINIVNGIITTARNPENNYIWSEEAKELFEKDLKTKIASYFGTKRYAAFSDDKKIRIESDALKLLEKQMKKNLGKGEHAKIQRIDERILEFITDNFDVEEKQLTKLYHPSAIDVYKPPVRRKDGNYYLGSPMVSSIRNPMAMRAMHQLRIVINELIKSGIIDSSTKIHIEMSRGLLNANERKATQTWQRENENRRKEYYSKIKEFLNEGEPTKDEILKYQLWEEQNHKCLYTGKEIAIHEFLGPNPSFDIEHTIPRSLSFDNSKANKTLCDNVFNRSVKKNKIPSELNNHSEIIKRIESWKEKYEELDKQIQIAIRQTRGATDKESKDRFIQKRHKLTYDRDYWRDKYQRFTMQDVPEGFKNSQLVDTGIITKYSRLYLKTLFGKVYTVKGNTVSDFRKHWGLQEEYEKKARINHIHHCIDAITIACITKEQYEKLAKFYHEFEDLHVQGVDQQPQVDKPWSTFTEDVKEIEKEVLISHYTPAILPKQSKKKLRKSGRIQYNKDGKPIYLKGDTVRGSLHKDTFYGAIKQQEVNKKGEIEEKIKYVVRKPLGTLEDSNIKNIVDERVREIVSDARKKEKELRKDIDSLKKKLQKAEELAESQIKSDIIAIEEQIKLLYSLPNKNGEPIPIKKVRLYQPSVTNPLHIKKQRDRTVKNVKPWKEEFYAANDGNYMMAIYENKDERGKIKRDFEIVNNLQAGEFFKFSVQNALKVQELGAVDSLFSQNKISGKTELPLKAIIKVGTMVILWENSPEEIYDLSKADLNKRLYKIVGLSTNRVKSGQKYYEFGNILMRHHMEASPASDLKTYDGLFESKEQYIPQRKMSQNQFNALTERVDFLINPLGDIEFINNLQRSD